MKKEDKLPEEVMILDLMGQTASQALRKPFKYVAGVYQNMVVHDWQTPGLRVRIGRRALALSRTTVSNVTNRMDRRKSLASIMANATPASTTRSRSRTAAPGAAGR
jgi:hypothetical protein